MIDFDHILSKVGYMGTYQIMILSMVFYSGIPSGLNSIAPVFMSYQPDYRCNAPPFDNETLYPDMTEEQILNLTTPQDDEGDYDYCYRYNYNPSECQNGSYDCLDGKREQIKCNDADGFYYDRSLFTETVVTEMDLVCDKVIYSYVATSLYMFGLLLGSLIFAHMSDRIGRQPTLVISSLGCAVGMIGAGLSHVYWLYALFRLIIAFFGYGLTISSFVTVMEIVGTQWRTLIGISFQVFFAIGYMILSGVAYGLQDWHNMQWACIVLSLPFGIFLFFIPESPRWLFSVNKEKKARKITKRMAKFNKVILTEKMWEEARQIGSEKEKLRGEVEDKQYSLKDLFRKPGIRIITLKVMFNWFVNSLVYYGLSLNVGSLGGNIFINNVIGGCMEIVSYFICILTMDFLGRRVLLSIMMLISGISLIVNTIISETDGDEDTRQRLASAFAFVGKMGISGSYAIIYNLTTELFPTVVRSNGIGIGSAAARIGGILSPFVIALQLLVGWLPNAIFGILGITGGILSLLFPETTGQKMLETLEQAELFYAGNLVEENDVVNSQPNERSFDDSINGEPKEYENKGFYQEHSTAL